MLSATYTPAENARFLNDLASHRALDAQQVARLRALAAKEAMADPAYVAYANEKVRAALAKPGRTYTEAEIDEQIQSW